MHRKEVLPSIIIKSEEMASKRCFHQGMYLIMRPDINNCHVRHRSLPCWFCYIYSVKSGDQIQSIFTAKYCRELPTAMRGNKTGHSTMGRSGYSSFCCHLITTPLARPSMDVIYYTWKSSVKILRNRRKAHSRLADCAIIFRELSVPLHSV
jgi:hypothetical protein